MLFGESIHLTKPLKVPPEPHHLGISAAFWHYMLMSLVSITAVASFDAVGSILVVALLVIPASTAYLFANSLAKMLL